MIAQVSGSQANVLIRGESGTGKELVARAIHMASPRKNMQFIVVNCAALPENLAESELFGHEKGSFTGANFLRKGRLNLLIGCKISIDEIGDNHLRFRLSCSECRRKKYFERVGGKYFY